MSDIIYKPPKAEPPEVWFRETMRAATQVPRGEWPSETVVRMGDMVDDLRAQLAAERAAREKAEREREQILKDYLAQLADSCCAACGKSREEFGAEPSRLSLLSERDALREKLEAAERDRESFRRLGLKSEERQNAALARVATIRRETLEEAAKRAGAEAINSPNDVWENACETVATAIRALASTEGEKTAVEPSTNLPTNSSPAKDGAWE